MNKILKQAKPILVLLVVCGLLIAGISYLMQSGNSSSQAQLLTDKETTLPGPLTPEQMESYSTEVTNEDNPIAVLNTNMGTIEIELFENWMPVTAGNFKKLINEGFYNGIKFHRVIEGFMIQGGDPITKTDEVLRYGTGGPGYSIPDEFVKADILSNARGTIAMANNGQPDSGGSQFFINLVDNTGLDFDKQPLTSKHPVFGQVVSGMDVVDAIGRVKTSSNNLPLEDVVIESATIK